MNLDVPHQRQRAEVALSEHLALIDGAACPMCGEATPCPAVRRARRVLGGPPVYRRWACGAPPSRSIPRLPRQYRRP